jgi:hemoglobin
VTGAPGVAGLRRSGGDDNGGVTSSAQDPAAGSAPRLPLRAREPGELFALLGGEETFTRLVHLFYEGVRADDILRPLYPEDELDAAEERLRLFLVQYWGGPGTYSQQRGHPRLRMRHAPFAIGVAERDAWLARMRAAMDEVGLPRDADDVVWRYFVSAADSMRNVEG